MSPNPYQSPVVREEPQRPSTTLKDLHSDLVLFRAPRSNVQAAAVDILQAGKFTVDHNVDGYIHATYAGWHGFGVTDRQTGTSLSIIFKECDRVTSVSLVHRTRRILFFVGAMFGSILQDEVDQLVSRLNELFDRVA